jgi:hypothetical protein
MPAFLARETFFNFIINIVAPHIPKPELEINIGSDSINAAPQSFGVL